MNVHGWTDGRPVESTRQTTGVRGGRTLKGSTAHTPPVREATGGQAWRPALPHQLPERVGVARGDADLEDGGVRDEPTAVDVERSPRVGDDRLRRAGVDDRPVQASQGRQDAAPPQGRIDSPAPTRQNGCASHTRTLDAAATGAFVCVGVGLLALAVAHQAFVGGGADVAHRPRQGCGVAARGSPTPRRNAVRPSGCSCPARGGPRQLRAHPNGRSGSRDGAASSPGRVHASQAGV